MNVFFQDIPQLAKHLEEEDEGNDKYGETKDTPTSVETEVERNQESSLEPIDPSLPKDWKYSSSHPQEQIIGDPNQGVRTRSKFRNLDNYLAFVSQIEPKSIEEAECDSDWLIAMQEELNQFERNKV